MPSIRCQNTTFNAEFFTVETTPRAVLDAEAAAVFALFSEREREFEFNPAVVTEYPAVEDPGTSRFLANPLDYIAQRCKVLNEQGDVVSRIVILTTYGDRLRGRLEAAGYHAERIDMPAGPDHTYAFTFNPPPQPGTGRTLYLEAVNEADPEDQAELRGPVDG